MCCPAEEVEVKPLVRVTGDCTKLTRCISCGGGWAFEAPGECACEMSKWLTTVGLAPSLLRSWSPLPRLSLLDPHLSSPKSSYP